MSNEQEVELNSVRAALEREPDVARVLRGGGGVKIISQMDTGSAIVRVDIYLTQSQLAELQADARESGGKWSEDEVVGCYAARCLDEQIERRVKKAVVA
jgi:hypothetical protein